MIIDLQADAAQFLRENVSSYEELETLLLVARCLVRAWSDVDSQNH